MPIPDAKFLDYLSGNPNPDDPHVYYSTQRYDQDASLRLKPEQLGRIDMKSLEAKTIPVFVGEPGRQTAVEAAAILFSDQGEMLYLRSSHSTTDCLIFETNAEGTDVPVFRGRGPESPRAPSARTANWSPPAGSFSIVTSPSNWRTPILTSRHSSCLGR